MQNLQSKLYTKFDDDPAPIVNFMKWLCESYEITDRPHILDIGCGPGRLLDEYAQLGWQVTGLEPDADFFEEAKKVAQKFENVAVRQGGFADIDDRDVYDMVAAVNDPFMYLLEVKERLDALRRMFKALRPGGVMFLEMRNFLWKLWLYRDKVEETSIIDGKKVQHIMVHKLDFHNAIWIHEDEYVIEGEIQGESDVRKTHKVAMITPPELFYFVQQAGFENLRTYNSYQARADEPLNSSAMLVSAQKPFN